MHDFAIRDGLIIGGDDAAPFVGDVGIEGDRIAEIGQVGAAQREIIASGLVVTPGFIDAHTHDDMQLYRDPSNRAKLAQGVTTVICGNCGFSAFPHRRGLPSPDLLGTNGPWSTYPEYVNTLNSTGTGPNMATFVGHNTLSSYATTQTNRRLSSRERAAVVDEAKRAVEQGALGISTGLIYEPGRYSSLDDLVEIVTAVADLGGLHSIHLRDEGSGLLTAIDEALEISRKSSAGVQISHLKSIGKKNWGSVKDALTRIDDAYTNGIDVAFDVYPYTAGSGPMAQYFDPDNIDRQRAELVQITRCSDFPDYEGRRLSDIASELDKPVEDITRSVITAPNAAATLCIIFEIDEDDMRTVLSHRLAMIGSDGIPQDRGVPHPRLLGTFPRVIGHYSRDQGLFDLTAAIRKMTAGPADRYGLLDRGRIRLGMFADIVIFDYNTIADRGTYHERRPPEGIQWVFVNGRPSVTPDGLTHFNSGRVLTRSTTDKNHRQRELSP